MKNMNRTRRTYCKCVVALSFMLILCSCTRTDIIMTTYNIGHGMRIAIPRDWTIIDNSKMAKVNNNTEQFTGLNQQDNTIIFAANYYKETSRPLATVRVSIRMKQVMSQSDIRNVTQTEMDEQARMASVQMNALLRQMNMHITNYKMTKEVMASQTAIRARYSEVSENGEWDVNVYMIYCGDRVVKLTLGYDRVNDTLLIPVVDRIRRSFQIL